jgi:hypothetical protein
VGARVTVADGTEQWFGTVRAGGTNTATGGPPEVHFGLGDRDVVDRVDITWPDGQVSRLKDLETRRIYTVELR